MLIYLYTVLLPFRNVLTHIFYKLMQANRFSALLNILPDLANFLCVLFRLN